MAANGRRRTEAEVRAYSQGFDDGVSATLEQMARGDILDPSAGIRRMAIGGLVTRPTLTLLGEEGPEMVVPLNPPKKKRKVSRYQKEFGRQMKRLKALHPRTKVTALMSRGHSATRKALGMKQKRRSR
jgi:hypothetical protein